MFDFLLEWLTIFDPLVAIIIFTAILMFAVTLIYKKMMNQALVSETKEEMKSLQERVKVAQKDGDMDKANSLMSELLKYNTELMKQTMKPMAVSFLLFILFVPWFSSAFAEGGAFEGKTVLVLPIFGDIGWFWTYLVFAIVFSILFRKILGVKL